MAMGDDKRARNQIDYQGKVAQGNLDNLRSRVVDQAYPQFWKNFVDSSNTQMNDYGNLMGGYYNFAKNGGFSMPDIAAIRSRAMAPNRAIFANARRDLMRMPGGTTGRQAALSRLQRDTGQAMSDTATNAEGMIAQMRQQGKLAGLQGGSSLYGATPGMMSTTGNQLLGNMQQQGNIEDLQTRLGLGMMNAQINAAQIPGKFDQWLGRAGEMAKIGRSVLQPWG